jgi:hypothetical protein
VETIARKLDRAFYAGRGFGINRSLCVLMGFYGKNREQKEKSEKKCNDGYEFRRPAPHSLAFHPGNRKHKSHEK